MPLAVADPALDSVAVVDDDAPQPANATTATMMRRDGRCTTGRYWRTATVSGRGSGSESSRKARRFGPSSQRGTNWTQKLWAAGLDEAEFLDGVALFGEFAGAGVDLAAAELVDVQALHDAVLAVLAHARERRDEALGYAVRTVGDHGHGHPVALGGAERPRADVVDRGVGGRGGRRGAAGLDDGGAALGDGGDVRVRVPRLIVDQVVGVLPVDLGVVQVGELGDGVVAPDGHVGDVVDRGAGLGSQLADGTVVVEAGHRGEAAGVEARRVLLGDERIGVGRVADDEDLDVLLGAVAEGLALRLEDATVGAEQVAALHAGLARHGTHEQRHVGIAERDVGVVGAHHVGEQRERAVVEFHLHAAEGAEGGSDLEQLQDDRGGRAEHGTRGDAEQEAVADLAGGTGDCDTNRSGHTPSVRRSRRRDESRSPQTQLRRSDAVPPHLSANSGHRDHKSAFRCGTTAPHRRSYVRAGRPNSPRIRLA
jgi:hypothetical protein